MAKSTPPRMRRRPPRRGNFTPSDGTLPPSLGPASPPPGDALPSSKAPLRKRPPAPTGEAARRSKPPASVGETARLSKPPASAGEIARLSKPLAPAGEAPRRKRASFSQKNLAVTTEGPAGERLAKALEVPERSGYELTHRFHPYPGRFHHHLPATLLDAFPPAKGAVCDPFMGGGTTLVEAILRGLPTIGNDLNPIAVLVARERTRPRTQEQAGTVAALAKTIAAQVETLRREKNPPRASLHHFGRLAREYQPHLLAEMVQWIRLINLEERAPLRETLQAVFSSGVVKFSNRPSDTQSGSAPPRYPKGAVTRFFSAKCEELLREQVALSKKLPGSRRVTLLQEDARLLPSVEWDACGMVLTSPPYPGTYDYLEQHALRIAWLELEEAPFAKGEMAPRREEGGGWGNVMRDVFSTISRVLLPGGSLFMVMGDWIEGTHAVDAREAMAKVGSAKGWRMDSFASVRRDVFSHLEKKAFARRGKWEHLMDFGREAAKPSRGA